MPAHLALLAQLAGPAESIFGVGLGVALGIFMLFMTVVGAGLALLAFWIWMLVDCAQSPENPSENRVAWILILVFTHWLGALLYFFIVRQPRQARLRAAATAATSPPPVPPAL
ncbi:MAG: hypothetical protein RIQ79_1086 [Verrucomicrobiota bacterium]